MDVDALLEVLGIFGLSTIGGAFLVKTLVKSGIEEAVKLNFSRHLESYRLELTKELEKLKAGLVNSQTLFSAQLAALTELRRISRRIVPRKSTPDMDWGEACEEMAHSFPAHADAIDEFLCKHEAVLPTDVVRELEHAVSIATDGQFEFTWTLSTDAGPQVSNQGIKLAEEFWETVKRAAGLLQSAVDVQVERRVDPFAAQ